MDQAQLNRLTDFIRNIAHDVLRDVYVRGKDRDVILPMTVLRLLDAVLEPTKQAVPDMKVAPLAPPIEKLLHRDIDRPRYAGCAYAIGRETAIARFLELAI